MAGTFMQYDPGAGVASVTETPFPVRAAAGKSRRERTMIKLSGIASALDPGFHAVPAGLARSGREAGGAGVIGVRFSGGGRASEGQGSGVAGANT